MSSLNADNASSMPPAAQQSHNACLSCRSSKVKCRYTSIQEPCDRCRRHAIECIFERHRRGRKPGTKLKRSHHPVETSLLESPSASTSKETQLDQGQPQLQAISNVIIEQNDETELDSRSSTWGTAGLQPASILSKEAQSGKFSLENILCVPNVLEPRHTAAPTGHSEARDDPIACHILTFPVALGLFESFMRCLNPYISQLDPKLHSFDYVRQKSPFLLTTILSTSSKAFHPSLHPALRSHSEKLLGEAFVQGIKSTETVQAICIFTYWKEPDEIRTWLLVGYAIRICIELGWHELEPGRVGHDESSSRERRNIERTWLVLFVYDRSLSLQLGKPWMIDQTEFILNADSWCSGDYAVPGGDLVLSSFVSLRRTSAETLQLASPSKTVFAGLHGEMLSKILNSGITTWEATWLPRFDHDDVAPCHRFLVNFYGLHLRLLLNSYSLQTSLANATKPSSISKSALWLCSSSAIGMLEQISDKFGPFKQLYFVQDSIHVMVAYAAIFLIKLLVSLPKNMRADLEPQSLDAITKTATTFEQQCATQRTGCAMQARFLRSVIEKYHTLRSRANSTVNSTTSTSRSSQHITLANSTSKSTSINESGSGPDMAFEINSSIHIDTVPLTQAVLGTNLFADKELWDNLLSNVGFWMGEGVPLSDSTGIF